MGVMYSAAFRNPASPGSDPPSLRRLVIRGAKGSRLDTSATTRCQVSDAELKEKGESACPAASRIGMGSARVKPMLLPLVDFRATLFNADHDQLELLTGDPPTPPTVVHGYIRDEIVDSPIPTCLNGGYAPQDCPTDQVALVSNTLSIPALTTGVGAARRHYMTNPPTCPPSRRWQTPVTFYYGDGVVETLVTEQPCQPAAVAGTARLAVSVPQRALRVALRTRSLRVAVRVIGATRATAVRAALRRVRRGGRAGRRILGRTSRPVTVAPKRNIRLRLRDSRLSRGRYEVAVRAPGFRRTLRRFSLR